MTYRSAPSRWRGCAAWGCPGAASGPCCSASTPAVLLPLLAAGAVVGALATRVVAPLLVRSDTGAAPVPATQPHWPWPAEAALLAVLLAGCMLAVAVVVTVQVRRADAAHLRVSP